MTLWVWFRFVMAIYKSKLIASKCLPFINKKLGIFVGILIRIGVLKRMFINREFIEVDRSNNFVQITEMFFNICCSFSHMKDSILIIEAQVLTMTSKCSLLAGWIFSNRPSYVFVFGLRFFFCEGAAELRRSVGNFYLVNNLRSTGEEASFAGKRLFNWFSFPP